jgi:DNA polymerase III epsilon subunit family exonuclease
MPALIPPPATSLVAFDLETTGLFPPTDRLVEVGAVRFDASGRVLDRFSSLVQPHRPMARAALAIHGITDADLADAPDAAVVLPAFLSWLGAPSDTALIAHNARFDAGFLGHEMVRLGLVPLPAWTVFDTLDLARRRLPASPNHRLDTLAAHLGLPADDAHRALGDSLRVMGLWLALASSDAEADAAIPPPMSFALFDGGGTPDPAPRGWESLADALTRGLRVQVRYTGGTHGPAPRLITPVRFHHRGGLSYVIAFCHRDRYEKAFRLDRIAGLEVIERVAP